MLWAYYGIVFFEHLTSPEDFSSTRDYNPAIPFTEPVSKITRSGP